MLSYLCILIMIWKPDCTAYFPSQIAYQRMLLVAAIEQVYSTVKVHKIWSRAFVWKMILKLCPLDAHKFCIDKLQNRTSSVLIFPKCTGQQKL